jgi:hypothetical protein
MDSDMLGRDGSQSKIRRRVDLGCLFVFVVLVGAFLGWGGWLTVHRAMEEKRGEACRHNLSALSHAMLMYLADNDQVFPPVKVWSGSLLPCLPNAGTLACPSGPKRQWSYALLALLGEIRAGSVADAEHTVMLFESDGGWNAAGTAELLPEKPRHFGGDNYAFVDGHTNWSLRRHVGEYPQWLWTKESSDEALRWQLVVRNGHDER